MRYLYPSSLKLDWKISYRIPHTRSFGSLGLCAIPQISVLNSSRLGPASILQNPVYRSLNRYRITSRYLASNTSQHNTQIRPCIKDSSIIGEFKSRLKQARRSHAQEGASQSRKETLEGSKRVVLFAMTANVCMFSAKMYSALASGSSSMFSEALHSLADVLNESLLLFGIQRSLRDPDQNHPYGFTSERYAWALVSGVGVFFLGGGVSIYHGLSGLLGGAHVIGDASSAVYVLGASLFFELSTMTLAYRHISESAKKAGVTFFEYLKQGADPTAVQVFLEDVASVAGVGLATICLSLAKFLNNPLIDALGSISIGLLLSCVAVFLIRRNIASLVEKSMDVTKQDEIVKLLEADPIVTSVHDIKSASIGPEWSRFKAEILFNGELVTQKYIESNPNFDSALEQLRSLKTDDERREWLVKQGGKIISALGAEVDRLELNISKKRPEVKHIDLEVL